MDTIGNRIERLIHKLNITKTAFSQTLKVSQPYISKLIAGNGDPSIRLIDDICEKFNVNVDWLTTGAGGDEDMFNKLSSVAITYNHFSYMIENSSPQKKAVLSALIELAYSVPDDKWDYIINQFNNCLNDSK